MKRLAIPALFCALAALAQSNGPSTVPISAMSMGQNANLNGYRPFPGSAAYNDISGNAVDTTNTGYFRTAVGRSHVDMTQIAAGYDMPYYVLNSAKDSRVYWVPIQTEHEAATGTYDTESDHTLIPLVAGIQGEGGRDITTCIDTSQGDVHATIIDVATHKLYAGYNTRVCGGVMKVYSMTVHDLDHPFEVQEPRGRTTEDVAGMVTWAAILGVRQEDVNAGAIHHAIRWTMHLASRAPKNFATLYTGMASHGGCGGGNCSGGRATVFGQRYRLPSSFDCSTAPNGRRWSAKAHVVCIAMKTYGMINADNGINCAAQGTSGSGFGYDGEMSQIACSTFEVVTEGTGKMHAAQVPDEDAGVGGGGTPLVIDETAIYNNASGGVPVPNNPGKPTAKCSVSARSVAIGSPVTFTYTGTNITDVFIDNAGGGAYGNAGSIVWTPQQSSSYQLTAKGINGWTYAHCGTVKVTGPTVVTPTATSGAGTFTTAQNVALAAATPGATVYYTIDGTNPTHSSTAYTAPIRVSANTTIKAIAYKSGSITSAMATLPYIIQTPGATPGFIGSANSGGLADGKSQSAPYTFSGGTYALIHLSYINTLSLPTSVKCNASAATLLTSQAGTSGERYTTALYAIRATTAGPVTCTATYPASVYGRLNVVEISGTSGLDASSSGTTTAYPNLNCGSITTTGTNRLLLVFGEVEYSAITASKGYRQIYTGAAQGAAYKPVPSASTTAVTLNTNNDSRTASCVALALKP